MKMEAVAQVMGLIDTYQCEGTLKRLEDAKNMYEDG